MKTQETISLNLVATLLVGFITSIILFFIGSGGQSAASSRTALNTAVIFVPIVVAGIAAFCQYRFVMKPWHKALGELVSRALNLEDAVTVDDKSAAGKSRPGKGSPSSQTGAPEMTVSGKTASSKPADDGASQFQNIASSSGQRPSAHDQLNLLRHSIETASVQVKDARQRERVLIQHAADVICVIDLKCKILSVNPAARTVWGYNPEELVGKQITDFLVSDDVKNTMKAIVGAEKSIDRIFFENRFRRKSGDTVDMLWSAHLSASDQGLFCIAHDITERKRAERLLKESEERLRLILEGLPAGVVVINQTGAIEFVNKTALHLTGFAADEIIGLPAANLFSFFKDSSSSFERLAKKSGVNPSFDCHMLRSNGERFPAEASTCRLTWRGSAGGDSAAASRVRAAASSGAAGSAAAGGAIADSTACLVVFLDATMKYEVERAKREFVAMVSHDLRTPLTTINLIFSYLRDGLGGQLSEDGAQLAGKGQESCKRLMTLVQDLLDLEKMKAGKFVMDISETAISEVIAAAVSAVEPYADSQEIKLTVTPSEDTVLCDGGRIIQVLINLLGNAIKFSVPEGTVKIESSRENEFLKLSVTNRGRTIPPDKLISIFEKFEQASSTEAEERKGTGLGLAISKTLIEQHGGRIWAESSAESGTRFLFTLPLAPAEGGES